MDFNLVENRNVTKVALQRFGVTLGPRHFKQTDKKIEKNGDLLGSLHEFSQEN